MTPEREQAVLQDFLFLGADRLPDRVLDAVLDRVPSTPQARASGLGRLLPKMSKFAVRAAVAAAIVASVVIGSTLLGGPSIGSWVTIGPNPTPSPAMLPPGGSLVPGRYLLGEPFPLRVSLSLGSGWEMWSPGISSDYAAISRLSPDPPIGHGLVFAIVDEVYANPCSSSQLQAVGPGVEDLAAALAAQPNTEASAAEVVTLDGYEGLYLEYTTVVDSPCGMMRRWPGSFGPRESLIGETDHLWIIDVDGTRLVIDAFSFADTEPSDVSDIHVIVESLEINTAD